MLYVVNSPEMFESVATPLLEECEDETHTLKGSPPRLPKLQSSIVGVKIPRLGVFFISLENYQSVVVKNGLA